MTTILALDAAWTVHQPSGVALVQERESGWRCIALAPSYEAFLAQADGKATDWFSPKFGGSMPDIRGLLAASHRLSGKRVDLVTIDMPLATVPFAARRKADDQISVAFGSRWCSAHSPNATRPGSLGAMLSATLNAEGYPLATARTRSGETQRTMEVYPHPALLSLLNRPCRVPYKVSKSTKYWPDRSLTDRIKALLVEFDIIRHALSCVFSGLDLELPALGQVSTLATLKRYEDALDALVCAWVGIEYVAGRAIALGDHTAAIWCPRNPHPDSLSLEVQLQ